MELLDGKNLSQVLKDEIKSEVSTLTDAGNRPPHLVAILVGEDGASQTYVNHKIRSCEYVGYKSTMDRFSADITQEELLARVEEHNQDDSVDGMIVQLPLPKHIDPNAVIYAIKPEKDVDGFHPFNVGKMTLGLPTLLPATPAGIMEMFKRYNISTSGKRTAVLGRSNIVGRPMSVLMSGKGDPGNSTVTICHSRTPKDELKAICLESDIIIVALGIPGFLTGDMVREGAVVIDVGITRVEDETAKRGFRLKGDVEFASVSSKCSYITPVPGGVGPMTVGMLLKNTLQAYKKRLSV
ncbi:bifunctional 5,10-methylene-tetrahydrofolate dehydrogenase/5,10-methylene-tetrahydrofolate cyclohydrolase [bacterium]|nr:bifunctional 5,10-methylene-tetrahydrofolate dehydrogenase/5,10-methylene-tetrahydrofolate cyclohydrolase [bacterium]